MRNVKNFSLCAPPEIIERITRHAEAEGMSRNAYVVNRILEGMGNEFIISALILLLKKNGVSDSEIESLKV